MTCLHIESLRTRKGLNCLIQGTLYLVYLALDRLLRLEEVRTYLDISGNLDKLQSIANKVLDLNNEIAERVEMDKSFDEDDLD